MMDLSDAGIVAPLTKATKDTLRKIETRPNELISISLSDDGKFFEVTPQFASKTQTLYPLPGSFQDVEGNWWNKEIAYGAHRAKSFLNRIPESTPNKAETTFKVATTDFSVIMIQSCWGNSKIIWIDQESKVTYEFLLARFFLQDKRAKVQANYKLGGTLPPEPSSYLKHGENPLADYQFVAMSMGIGQEGLALFMEQGTGKTATTIARICTEAVLHKQGKLGNKPRMMRALIICPPQVRTNWMREFEKFTTIPGKVTILKGGPLERAKKVAGVLINDEDYGYSVGIISYDTMVNDVGMLSKIPWDFICADESHRFKGSRTERAKAMMRLREATDRRQVLTGTPIANNIFDLYSQLEFLAEGMSGFSNREAFRRFHGKFENTGHEEDGQAVSKLVGYSHVPLLQERLARISFSITKEEAGLNLPPKVYEYVEVEMTPRQTKAYSDMASSLLLEIEGILQGKNAQVEAQNVLTMLLRLSQICSGHMRIAEQYDDTTFDLLAEAQTVDLCDPDPNPKIEQVLEIMRDEPKERKTVIWGCFKQDMVLLREALETEGIGCRVYDGSTPQSQREGIVDEFNNDPEMQVLIANPAAASEGLNLLGYDVNNPDDHDTYCGRMIFFSQNWNALHRSQAEDRGHRRGTREQLIITDLFVPDTIDEEQRIRVRNKQDSARLVQDIQDILKSQLRPQGEFNFA